MTEETFLLFTKSVAKRMHEDLYSGVFMVVKAVAMGATLQFSKTKVYNSNELNFCLLNSLGFISLLYRALFCLSLIISNKVFWRLTKLFFFA